MAKKNNGKHTPARGGKSAPAARTPITSARSTPAASPRRHDSTIEKKPNGVKANVSATAGQITRDDIALAAFLRWQREGGDEVSNWLAAERELLGATRR